MPQLAVFAARSLSSSTFFPRSLRTKSNTLLFYLAYMYPSFASFISQSQSPPAGPGLDTFCVTHHTPAIRMANTPSFYMRELPKDHLIGYDTVEGKRLFKQALLEGGLEAFFPLSQQFLTVSSPGQVPIGAPELTGLCLCLAKRACMWVVF